MELPILEQGGTQPRPILVKDLLRPPEVDVARILGPAALLFLPAAPIVERAFFTMSALRTVSSPILRLVERTLALLRAFPEMQVSFLPKAQSGRLVIGRSHEASLTIGDASMSRSHAVLRWSGERYWLRDQGSLNGTYINTQPFAGECELQDGDTIALGDAQLVFVSSPTLALQLQSLRVLTHDS